MTPGETFLFTPRQLRRLSNDISDRKFIRMINLFLLVFIIVHASLIALFIQRGWPVSVVIAELAVCTRISLLKDRNDPSGPAAMTFFNLCCSLGAFGVLFGVMGLPVFFLLCVCSFALFPDKRERNFYLGVSLFALLFIEWSQYGVYTIGLLLTQDQFNLLRLTSSLLLMVLLWVICRQIFRSFSLQDRLHKASQYLKYFGSHIAHDLKKPLDYVYIASLRLHNKLKREEISMEEISHVNKSILSTVKLLANIVSNIMDLRQAEDGKSVIANNYISTRDFFTDLTASHEPMAQHLGKSLQLELDIPALIRSDERALTRIISNLLLNALQHAREGSTVKVRVGADNISKDAFQIQVINEGGAISLGKLAHIRRIFTSPEEEEGPEDDHGFGLRIVKSKVTDLGGAIEVQSYFVGYTVFTVTLPLHAGEAFS